MSDWTVKIRPHAGPPPAGEGIFPVIQAQTGIRDISAARLLAEGYPNRG